MSNLIKTYCRNIQNHEGDNLDIGTHKTLKAIQDEADRLEIVIKQQQDRLDSYYNDCSRLIEKNVAMKTAISEHGERVAWFECEGLIKVIDES